MEREISFVKIAFEMINTDTKRWISYILPFGIGLALAVISIDHGTAPHESLLGRFLSLAAVVGLSFPLISGGYWLARRDYSPAELWRVTTWCLGGAVPITLLAVLIVIYQRSEGVSLADPLVVVVWVAGGGAVGGFLTGVYDVRSIRERTKHRDIADRLQALIETVPVALIAHDMDDTVTLWNPGAEDIFGWSADEACGEPYPIVPEKKLDEYHLHQERARRGEKLEGVETQRERKDGSKVDVRIWSAPLHDEFREHVGTILAITDITERKQSEQRLQVLNRVFRHNMRNSLNLIAGHASLLEERLPDDEHLSSLNTIEEATQELLELSETVTDVESALDPARDHAQQIDVVELIDQARTELRRAYPSADISIDAPSTAPVTADSSLGRAVREAIENAIEHNDRSEPTVDVTVEVHEAENQVKISIADNGPGIPVEERKTLDIGEEAPLSHSSGLGLWLIKWIVERHNGELMIDDNDPRGSIVSMTFPRGGTTTGHLMNQSDMKHG